MIEELDVIALTHPFPCPPTAVFRRTPFARAADSCFPENPSHARPGEGDPLLLTQLFRQMDLIEPFVGSPAIPMMPNTRFLITGPSGTHVGRDSDARIGAD